MIRVRVRFSGRVQGVGFRYSCARLATQNGVTGWVRNDPGGTVTAELQGTKSAVDNLITSLGSQPFIRVTGQDQTVIPVVSNEQGFQVAV